MGELVKINNIDIWYEEFGNKNHDSILLIMGVIQIANIGLRSLLTN